MTAAVKHGLAGHTPRGCPDPQCREARRLDRRDRYRAELRIRGGPTLIDVGPTRAHIDRLLAAGMSLKSIQQQAALPAASTLHAIRFDAHRIHRDTAERILRVRPLKLVDAVDPDDVQDARQVSVWPVRRRIGALSRIGWNLMEISTRTGISHRSLVRIMGPHHQHPYCRQKVGDAVRRLYEELWNQPGPSGRARRWATVRGFPPPLAYDEHELNDPHPLPLHRLAAHAV